MPTDTIRSHDLCSSPDTLCRCRGALYVRTPDGYRAVCLRSYRELAATAEQWEEPRRPADVACAEQDLSVCVNCEAWQGLLNCRNEATIQRPPIGTEQAE